MINDTIIGRYSVQGVDIIIINIVDNNKKKVILRQKEKELN